MSKCVNTGKLDGPAHACQQKYKTVTTLSLICTCGEAAQNRVIEKANQLKFVDHHKLYFCGLIFELELVTCCSFCKVRGGGILAF